MNKSLIVLEANNGCTPSGSALRAIAISKLSLVTVGKGTRSKVLHETVELVPKYSVIVRVSNLICSSAPYPVCAEKPVVALLSPSI